MFGPGKIKGKCGLGRVRSPWISQLLATIVQNKILMDIKNSLFSFLDLWIDSTQQTGLKPLHMSLFWGPGWRDSTYQNQMLFCLNTRVQNDCLTTMHLASLKPAQILLTNILQAKASHMTKPQIQIGKYTLPMVGGKGIKAIIHPTTHTRGAVPFDFYSVWKTTYLCKGKSLKNIERRNGVF